MGDELAAFAERVFALERRQPDGATLRQHLQSWERTKKRKHPLLQVPPLPLGLRGIWSAFLEVTGRRQMGGFGPGPLTYPDLDAWARLTGRRLTPLDVRLLCRLDDCWLASQFEETAE